MAQKFNFLQIARIQSELGQTEYGYDNLNRLTQATPGQCSYNADNQLTQYPYLKPFSPGSQPVDTTVSYTAQGHTQKESSSQWTKDYGYSAAERLIRYKQTSQGQSNPQIEAQYKYDPFGRRISKTITQGGTTTTTYFVYGEQGLMAEANEAGRLTKAYGFNPIAAQQGLWSTDPIWQAEISNASLTDAQTQYHYLHTDHLGTPQLATTKDGSTSWKAAAEAFGAAGIIQSQSTIEMNLRFPGQYYDEETGTHYNFHRDYKPNQGRCLQSDPIGLEGGINYFSYVYASPLKYFDVHGLKRCKKSKVDCEKDACGCQRDVLYELCKCYEDTWFWQVKERGVCTEKAYLKKVQCIGNCEKPIDECCGDKCACVNGSGGFA